MLLTRYHVQNMLERHFLLVLSHDQTLGVAYYNTLSRAGKKKTLMRPKNMILSRFILLGWGALIECPKFPPTRSRTVQ